MILDTKKNVELTTKERKEIDKLCKKIKFKIPKEVLIIKNMDIDWTDYSNYLMISVRMEYLLVL